MTTTSLKHIVSNVENIRNLVITHCYYGNQPLLSFFVFPLSLFPICFMCFLFLFLSFATGVCFSFLQPIARSPVFVHHLILVALHFAYRPLDPHLYLLSICLANASLSDPVNSMRTLFAPCVWSPLLLYPHFSVISSSWYIALDTNDEETISRVLTSFRNQSSRFLLPQYHLGGMRL